MYWGVKEIKKFYEIKQIEEKEPNLEPEKEPDLGQKKKRGSFRVEHDKLRDKLKLGRTRLVGIFIIAIIVIAGIGYYLVNENTAKKNIEINLLKEEIDSLKENLVGKSREITSLQNDLTKKTDQMTSLQKEFEDLLKDYMKKADTVALLRENLIEKDDEIKSLRNENVLLQQKIRDTNEFIRLYIKALNTIEMAWLTHGNGFYDSANYYYEQGYLFDAEESWTWAMKYYHTASGYFDDAKTLFRMASYHTSDGHIHDIVENYINLANSGFKLMRHISEASGHFAKASRYYIQEMWIQGDSSLEMGNESVASHDAEVLTYNSLLWTICAIIGNP